jgi:hypothetical protein
MQNKFMHTSTPRKGFNSVKNIESTFSHQKRFGQYFSGKKVAALLSLLLPKGLQYDSIIDPMAGEGDLLNAVAPNATQGSHILGVEIDELVASACQKRLPQAMIICEDAFKSQAIITERGWDLVVTNPPYVRYQLQNDDSSVMPTGKSIRSNLGTLLTQLTYLDEDEKNLLLRIAKNYSGLSDMAVPSWILCAALVKMGGILAMVVPETWLNREYAKPIQYLLLKTFDILCIARDVNACWFDNAQVRTCILIAKKKQITPLSDVKGDTTLVIDLGSELVSEGSLIDNLTWKGVSGREALTNLLSSKTNASGHGFSVDIRKTTSLFPYLFATQRIPKWTLSSDFQCSNNIATLPLELCSVINDTSKHTYISLEDLGVHCGQGLRTGANDFFYFQIMSSTGNEYSLKTGKWFGEDKIIKVPHKYIIHCVQNRRQISGLAVNPKMIDTGILYLQDYIRSQDFVACTQSAANHFQELPSILNEYITAAEEYKNAKGISFKDYSAVKPNEKKFNSQYERFWYMLPHLSQRHIPNLCITRVSSTAAECIYVPQQKDRLIAVDANFVTLWGNSEETVKVCLALLNSTWSKCYLELLCTVMGGGALKIEASHLRNVLFPKFTSYQFHRLLDYGTRIADEGNISPELCAAIDSTVLEQFSDSEYLLVKIKKLLQKRLNERGAKYEL